MIDHPLRASRTPSKGAPLADRQSRIRGGRWKDPVRAQSGAQSAVEQLK